MVGPWSERGVRILRRNYGKPGRSLHTIAAKLGRNVAGYWFKGGLARFELAARIPGIGKGTSKLSNHRWPWSRRFDLTDFAYDSGAKD